MHANGNYRVPAEMIIAYDTDGVVRVPGVADGETVERLRGAIDDILDSEAGTEVNYFKRLRIWERNQAFRDFCLNSALPQIAGQLLSSEKVNLFYDQLFVKEAGSNAPTPWHNDLPYWPVRGNQVVTFWVALDPVTLENGGVEFVRGSHKLSKWYRPFSSDNSGRLTGSFQGDDNDPYEDLPDIEGDRSKFDIVSYDLEPGDALAFHGLTLHGARGNTRSDRRRRGYAIRLTGGDVRYHAGKVWNEDIVNPSLKSGDLLDSDQYPVVLQAS